jgi:ubiquinone/menaquinone biosynthesis C-methylase UbiE
MDPLRAFFEQLALEWNAQQPPDRDEALNRLLTPFDARFPGSGAVLDVGTGTGALIPVLQKRYPALTIVSIDLATAMLRFARQRCSQANLVQADVHWLPFRDQVFSTVVCHNSFPHFWRKVDALHELRRATVLGGHLLILHDLSRQEVNSIHQSASAEVIRQDLLPPGEELAQWLLQTGFMPLDVQDGGDRYIVSARAV